MRRQSPADRPASIERVKNELIGRGNDFVSQQRLNSLRQTAISENELDDPLVLDPMRLVNVDYDEQGRLVFNLSQSVNDTWAHAFRNFGSHTSVMGKGPESFTLKGATASIQANEHNVKDIIKYFKEWLPLVNNAYKVKVLREKQQKTDEARRRLQAKIAEEERIQRIRNSIRST